MHGEKAGGVRPNAIFVVFFFNLGLGWGGSWGWVTWAGTDKFYTSN